LITEQSGAVPYDWCRSFSQSTLLSRFESCWKTTVGDQIS